MRAGQEQSAGYAAGVAYAVNKLKDFYESEVDLDIDEAIEFLEELLEETTLKEELLYSSSY
tara:strand:+ start:284 stop:466 length:183 start_codon:yes stop_codon:yes gene_type:complete